MTRYRSGSWCHAVSTQDSKIGNTWEDEVVTLQTVGRRCMHTVKTQTDKRHEVSIFVCLCIAGAHSTLSEDVSHARSAKNTTLLYHLFVETRTCVATETRKMYKLHDSTRHTTPHGWRVILFSIAMKRLAISVSLLQLPNKTAVHMHIHAQYWNGTSILARYMKASCHYSRSL